MQNIVVFVVGKDRDMLQIPKRTVCQCSELVDAECKNLPDMTVLVKQLPNVRVEIFTLFLVWLSTGDLNNAESFASPPASPSALDLEDTSDKLGQLIRCYHLSEELIARPFQNYIADQICNYLEYLVDKDGLLERSIACNIPLVYKDALKESKLKCLLEYAIVTRATGIARCKLADIPEVEPMVSAFWNGVAVAAIRRTKELEAGRMRFPLNWGEEDMCKYHEHRNGDEVEDCREKRLENPR